MLDLLLSMPVACSSAVGQAFQPVAANNEHADLTPLKRLIIEKTEGNPFFIEEMVQRCSSRGF